MYIPSFCAVRQRISPEECAWCVFVRFPRCFDDDNAPLSIRSLHPFQTDETPLHFAAAYARAACCAALLSRPLAFNCDPNAPNRWGQAPLHVACIHWSDDADTDTDSASSTDAHNSGPSADTVNALVNGGASVHARTADGWAPLHCAALNGHWRCAELLLLRGADPAAVNSEGLTPLEVAEADERLSEAQREALRRVLAEAAPTPLSPSQVRWSVGEWSGETTRLCSVSSASVSVRVWFAGLRGLGPGVF